jgi:hypothetical protein
VAAIEAVQDAAIAAIIEPFAPPELHATLADRFQLLERSADLGAAFDLTRATAGGIDAVRAGRWTVRALAAAVIVAVAILVLATGSCSLDRP